MSAADDKQLSLRLLAGFAVGIAVALLIRSLGVPAEGMTRLAGLFGEIFLRGIFMLILPLVVPILLLGIQRISATGAMGKVGLHTLLTVGGLTIVAATIGLLAANLLQPGTAVSPEAQAELSRRFGGVAPVAKAPSHELLLNLLPKNPFREVALAFSPEQQGGLLAVVFFVVIFGISLARLPAETTQPLYHSLEAIYQASLWLLLWVMRWIAPFGIAGLIFQAVVGLGWEVFPLLGAYMGTVALGLAVHGLGVYTIFLRAFARRSPWHTLRESFPALLVAFSSASSNATLPTTLRVAIERLQVAPPIAQFIVTLGATVNQNGTALYEGVTLLFLFQVFGVPLSFSEQALVIGLAMLIAIGAAGVPGGSIPLLAGVLPLFGVPAAAIALIYGIDRLLDMLRTTLNVYGDLVIATYLNRLYHGASADSGGA